MKTILPNFAGFYETNFDFMMDNEYEQYENDCFENNKPALEQPNWEAGRLAISKGVVQAFNQETGLNLEFVELVSPKEYNFTTDKIICEIPDEEFAKIRRKVLRNRESFAETLKELFTPRNGFVPFYSNEVKDWTKDKQWNEVEVMTFLQAWFDIQGFDWNYAEDKPCVYEAAQAIWN